MTRSVDEILMELSVEVRDSVDELRQMSQVLSLIPSPSVLNGFITNEENWDV